MSERYIPEFGQALFGQPWQAYALPDWLVPVITEISESLESATADASPFDNTGERFDNGTFAVESYAWDDERRQPWNFKYGDIEISWYKRFPRGASINRIPTHDEAAAMLNACLASLRPMEADG